MDLFQSDVGAINSGNMRNQATESVNEAIAFHNNELAKQAEGIRSQAKSALSQQRTEQTISGIMSGAMEARGLKSGIESYKDYVAQGISKAQALSQKVSSLQDQAGALIRNDPAPSAEPTVEARPNTTTEPNITATPEGAPAQGTADPNPSAVEHGAITAGKEDTGKTGSMFHNGLKSITGISDDAIDRVGKGVGALGSSAVAGINIYNDIKQGKLGDNGFEDVGQVAQIGGAISDIVGTVFPPAELLGGALGVVGGIFSDIGQEVSGNKKEKEADEADQQAKEKTQASTGIGMAVAPTAQIAPAPRVSS